MRSRKRRMSVILKVEVRFEMVPKFRCGRMDAALFMRSDQNLRSSLDCHDIEEMGLPNDRVYCLNFGEQMTLVIGFENWDRFAFPVSTLENMKWNNPIISLFFDSVLPSSSPISFDSKLLFEQRKQTKSEKSL